MTEWHFFPRIDRNGQLRISVASRSVQGNGADVLNTNSSTGVNYILKDSGAKIICVSTEKQLEKVIAIRDDLPSLEQIIIFDPVEGETPEGVIQFDAACALAGEEPNNTASEDDPCNDYLYVRHNRQSEGCDANACEFYFKCTCM